MNLRGIYINIRVEMVSTKVGRRKTKHKEKNVEAS